jgi:hypothetical protein
VDDSSSSSTVRMTCCKATYGSPISTLFVRA